jgi:hypothetical protein
MKNKPLLSLRDEYSGVEEDIQNYLNTELQELRLRFEGHEMAMEDILDLVAVKADGSCRSPRAYSMLTCAQVCSSGSA